MRPPPRPTLFPYTTFCRSGQRLLQAQWSQRQAGLKQVAIGIEHLQKAVQPTAIAEVGEPRSFLQRVHQLILLAALLARVLVADQRIGDFPESVVDRKR